MRWAAVAVLIAFLAGCVGDTAGGPDSTPAPTTPPATVPATAPPASAPPPTTSAAPPPDSTRPAPGPTQEPAPTTEPLPAPGPARHTPAWAPAEAAVLRPGDQALAGNSLCTFDFLFFDPWTGRAFVGLAGHCTEDEGQMVEMAADGRVIGTVVFDSDLAKYAGTGVDVEWLDFTLVELGPGMAGQSNPQVRAQDGPTGILRAGDWAVNDLVAIHGHGAGVGLTPPTRDRMGLLQRVDTHWGAQLPTVNGDSGGPVLHLPTGKAAGLVSGFRCCADLPPTSSYGPSVEWVLRQLAVAGWAGVELALADGSLEAV